MSLPLTMSLNCWQEVIDDYERLLETDEGYDVIIYAGENENVKELHALSNILCIRSQYFRTALSNEWAKKKDGKFILEKPTISPNIFKIILR
uniref:BTB domain-containing protein n=1 Tax=Rhizophagus irregularis (strain DAOM 181602 / DAOM 197198 / MUCL 43194) TaxID=747089 RepID=U9TCL4_RHIID